MENVPDRSSRERAGARTGEVARFTGICPHIPPCGPLYFAAAAPRCRSGSGITCGERVLYQQLARLNSVRAAGCPGSTLATLLPTTQWWCDPANP